MRVLLIADPKCFQLQKLVVALERRGAAICGLPPARLTHDAILEADLLILDPSLTYRESIAICGEARVMSEITIIMISDYAQSADRIQGLRAGADDYVTRPCDVDELIARIIATTRPRGRTHDTLSMKLANRHLGDMTINPERMQVTIAGEITELTKKEFQILALIAGEGGKVCPRERLAAEVWGQSEDEVYDSIQVIMSRLRSKIGPHRIKTVRSIGYQLVTPSDTAEGEFD